MILPRSRTFSAISEAATSVSWALTPTPAEGAVQGSTSSSGSERSTSWHHLDPSSPGTYRLKATDSQNGSGEFIHPIHGRCV